MSTDRKCLLCEIIRWFLVETTWRLLIHAPQKPKFWLRLFPFLCQTHTHTHFVQPIQRPIHWHNKFHVYPNVVKSLSTQNKKKPIRSSQPAVEVYSINDNQWLFKSNIDHYSVSVSSFKVECYNFWLFTLPVSIIVEIPLVLDWWNGAIVSIYTQKEEKKIVITLSIQFLNLLYHSILFVSMMHDLNQNYTASLFQSLSVSLSISRFFPILVCHSVHIHIASKSINHKLLKWNVSALTLCHRYTSCEHLVLQLHARNIETFAAVFIAPTMHKLCTSSCMYAIWLNFRGLLHGMRLMVLSHVCRQHFTSATHIPSIHTKRKPSNSLGST